MASWGSNPPLQSTGKGMRVFHQLWVSPRYCLMRGMLGPNIAWVSPEGQTALMASLRSGGLSKIHHSRHGWLHLLVPSPGIIKILKGRAWEKAGAD